MRKPDYIGGYRVIFKRYVTWVIHNLLDDNRSDIIKILTDFVHGDFLANPPSNYKPRDTIYLGTPYTYKFDDDSRNAGKSVEGILGIVLALDAPTDKRKRLLVRSIQLPVSPDTAQPGYHHNCHVTTEIYPADGHSLIPVTYEFVRGTIPGKRVNIIVGHDGKHTVLPEVEGIVTDFKHFISAEYSQYGLSLLDFQLDVPHRPSRHGDSRHDGFLPSKEGFQSKLRDEVRGPVRVIERELYKDRGTLAPPDINPGTLLDNVSAWMAEFAYGDLDIFKSEVASNVNPPLQKERFGKDIEVPTATTDELPPAAYSEIARALVLYPGSLAALLMLADHQRSLDMERIKDVVPQERFVETIAELRRTDLISIKDAHLWVTDLGRQVVNKLRAYTRKHEGADDVLG